MTHRVLSAVNDYLGVYELDVSRSDSPEPMFIALNYSWVYRCCMRTAKTLLYISKPGENEEQEITQGNHDSKGKKDQDSKNNTRFVPVAKTEERNEKLADFAKTFGGNVFRSEMNQVNRDSKEIHLNAIRTNRMAPIISRLNLDFIFTYADEFSNSSCTVAPHKLNILTRYVLKDGEESSHNLV